MLSQRYNIRRKCNLRIVGVEPFLIAAAIEEAVHKKKTDAEYKTRMRTIMFNLKDKKNPQLRRRVVLEEISPEDFAVMSSEDMASDQKQDEIKKIRSGIPQSYIQFLIASGTIV